MGASVLLLDVRMSGPRLLNPMSSSELILSARLPSRRCGAGSALSRGVRVAIVASVAAVIWMVAVGTHAVVSSGRGGGLPAFNACIRATGFLALVQHGSRQAVIETLRDRALRVVEGEVASGRAAPILGGAATADGRYLMSTVTPLGRDASAIESCWDRVFPIAPNA